MATLSEVIRRGTRAVQPAASTVPAGVTYHVTDEGVTERSNGSVWEDISATATADWQDVDTDLLPDADVTRDIGSASKQFVDGFFSGVGHFGSLDTPSIAFPATQVPSADPNTFG